MVTRKNNRGDKANSFITNSGSPVEDVFIGELQKDGTIKLTKTGERNVYDEIQSYKDSVDINKLVERYREGDINCLNQIQGVYADFTQAPKNIHDALEKIAKARYYFDRLEPEVRSRFDNNFENWASTAGEENWFKFMDTTKENVEKTEAGEKGES